MSEIWKDIECYEGLYQVSNLGRVKSLYDGRHKIFREKVLSPKDTRGYLHVVLCKNGKRKDLFVHRLVALAFIPNPQNLPEVNHKDEDKTNNCVENLEWCTRKENCNFGTRNIRSAEKLTNGILAKKVLQYTLDGTLVREWPSIHEIKRQLKYHDISICRCCNGKQKTAYGYIWKYA